MSLDSYPELKLLAQMDLGREMFRPDERASCANAHREFSVQPEQHERELRVKGRPVIQKRHLKAAAAVANTYCGECPLLLACARYADTREEEGLWAGSWRIKPARGPVRKINLLLVAPAKATA